MNNLPTASLGSPQPSQNPKEWEIPDDLAALIADTSITVIDPKTNEPVREATWSPPLRITDDQKDRSRIAATEIEHALRQATFNDAKTWILSLGNLVKVSAKVTAQDAIAKVSVYADMLEHPGGVYTRKNLKLAAREFSFFPSFAELDKFLADRADELRQTHARLQNLVALEAPKSPLPEALQAVGINANVIRLWFLNVSVKFKGDREMAIVIAPSAFHRDHIAREHRYAVQKALRVKQVEFIAVGQREPELSTPQDLSAVKAVLGTVASPESEQRAAERARSIKAAESTTTKGEGER